MFQMCSYNCLAPGIGKTRSNEMEAVIKLMQVLHDVVPRNGYEIGRTKVIKGVSMMDKHVSTQ